MANVDLTTQSATGIMSLRGDLTLTTVADLWIRSQPLFAQAKSPIQLDLQNVVQSDSAGVALLIAWIRHLRQERKELLLLNLPAQMQAIIQVSGLSRLLPISHYEVKNG